MIVSCERISNFKPYSLFVLFVVFLGKHQISISVTFLLWVTVEIVKCNLHLYFW